MQRVAVIGAGLAGLTCARSLQGDGHEVVVFEKSRGVGGRLSTRRTDSAQYDHGAQYFTVRDRAFALFIKDRLAEGSVAIWQPQLDAKLSRSVVEPWYVGCPGMSALGRAQAVGLDVRSEQRVQALLLNAGLWSLATEDGNEFEGFGAVVVAVPNAQAVPLVQPHAPDWALQLQNTPMEPCWTLMLSTSDALTDFDVGLPRSGAIGWWARNSSKPGRPVQPGRHDWVIQASAAWTEANLETSKPDVEHELLLAFARELGVSAIEPVLPVMAHRWLYSRRATGLTALPEPCFDPVTRLGVCGDGLTHSRVEQAYLSGLGLGLAMRQVLA